MVDFAITVDWEVMSPSFDGLVDIDIDIVEQMMTNSYVLTGLADSRGIKLTYMLELAEYELFHSIPELEAICRVIDRFIVRILSAGHDIQAHGHGEWVTARYEGGRWYRAFQHRDNVHEIMGQFFSVFDRAVARVKSLVPSWKPQVYRAGAYLIDPISEMAQQFLPRGIIADTSRHTKNYGDCWKESGLIELPIYGVFPTKNDRWDLNLLPSEVALNRCFEVPFMAGRNVPLVMIGHSKMTMDFAGIDQLFGRLIKVRSGFRTRTLGELAIGARDGLYQCRASRL